MSPPLLFPISGLQIHLDQVLKFVHSGGILLFPTETVYGLGVDSARPEAIDRLYAIKGRPKEKPFQWLVSSAKIASQHSSGWSPLADALAKAFWPGPLTLVVPSGSESVGWRVPRHDGILELLKALNRPLIATSANRAGKPPALSCEEGVAVFGEEIALALDGGKITIGQPSTVVRVSGDQVEILREGAISKLEVLRCVD